MKRRTLGLMLAVCLAVGLLAPAGAAEADVYKRQDNVCERAALLGAERLLVKKTARDGVTVAVAAEHWEVRFG